MKSKLIFPFLLLMIFVSAQRNREAEDSARLAKRQKYFIEKDNKFGLKDSLGKIILSPVFDNIDFFEKDLFIIRKDSLSGIINKSGSTIVPIQYKDIKSSENNFSGSFDNEKNSVLKKYFKDFLFVYANDDNYDEQFGIYSKNGKLLYPPIIHKFSDVKEFKDSLYIIVGEYPEIKGFTARYNGSIMKTQGTRLVTFKNDVFESRPVQAVYSDLKFLNLRGKNIVYYRNGSKGGFYNLENGKKTDRKYQDYRFSDTKIYAKKNKFYNYILDENFRETISKDSINRVENNYLYIADGGNMRLMKNGKKSKFSYPLIKSVSHYSDSAGYGQYFKDKDYEDYLTNIFEFYPIYPDGKNRQNGIINFEGKVFVQPKYEDILILPLRVFSRESYDESKVKYYKENHLDYLILPKSREEGLRIINSFGEDLVYIDKIYIINIETEIIILMTENKASQKIIIIKTFLTNPVFSCMILPIKK